MDDVETERHHRLWSSVHIRDALDHEYATTRSPARKVDKIVALIDAALEDSTGPQDNEDEGSSQPRPSQPQPTTSG